MTGALVAKVLCVLLVCTFAQAFEYDYCGAPPPNLYPPPKQGLQLAQLLVVTRHGDRAPANILPNEDIDWWCDADIPEATGSAYYSQQVVIPPTDFFGKGIWQGNCLNGQLTKKGSQQHYAIGEKLREIYVDKYQFLNATYDRSSVFVRSSDQSRTLQSAQSLLLGMYPPQFRPNTDVTIAIYKKPNEIENMFINPNMCPAVATVANQKTTSKEWQQHQNQYKELHQKLNQICDTANLTAWSASWDHFFDNLHCRYCHGKPLPCKTIDSKNGTQQICVTPDDLQQISKGGDWETVFLNSGSVEVSKANIGTFINDLLQTMSSVTTGKKGPKFALFSAHDNTISNILGGFRITDFRWPPYASHLIMESWQEEKTGSYYVRVLYNGDVLQLGGECNGQDVCSWEDFRSFVAQNAAVQSAAEYQQYCFI